MCWAKLCEMPNSWATPYAQAYGVSIWEPKAGMRSVVEQRVPGVEQMPEIFEGIDMQRCLAIVELHAAAVTHRHEQGERDEERRN